MVMVAVQSAQLNHSITVSMVQSMHLPNVSKYAVMAIQLMLNAMMVILTMAMAAHLYVKSRQDFPVQIVM